MSHTPGPWQRHYSSSTPDEWVIGGEGFAPVIAFVTRDEDDQDMPGAIVEGNARLITASPELLDILGDAVRELRIWLDNARDEEDDAIPIGDEILARADALMARIEGAP